MKIPIMLAASLALTSSVFANSLTVATPLSGATRAWAFTVNGTSSGIDAVHVWAFPSNSDPVLLGATDPICPPPGAISTCRFSLTAQFAPEGTYPVVVYGHDATTNTWPNQVGLSLTIVRGPAMLSGFGDWATMNPTGLDDAFQIVTGMTPNVGGVIVFGRPWPSPPSCVGSAPNARVYVSSTREHATVTMATENPGAIETIHVLCGGGR